MPSRYVDVFTHPDHKKTWPGLRYEVRRIDHNRSAPIAPLGKRRHDRHEVATAMGRDRAIDIFQYDRGGRSALISEAGDMLPKRPESARPCARESCTGPGKGEILARE